MLLTTITAEARFCRNYMSYRVMVLEKPSVLQELGTEESMQTARATGIH